MRIPFETIKEHGKRVSSHSKFYIYDDMVFEPVYHKGKKCKNYKALEKWRAREILLDAKKRMDEIGKVSQIFPGFEGVKNKKTKKKSCRFDLLDL